MSLADSSFYPRSLDSWAFCLRVNTEVSSEVVKGMETIGSDAAVYLAYCPKQHLDYLVEKQVPLSFLCRENSTVYRGFVRDGFDQFGHYCCIF